MLVCEGCNTVDIAKQVSVTSVALLQDGHKPQLGTRLRAAGITQGIALHLAASLTRHEQRLNALPVLPKVSMAKNSPSSMRTPCSPPLTMGTLLPACIWYASMEWPFRFLTHLTCTVITHHLALLSNSELSQHDHTAEPERDTEITTIEDQGQLTPKAWPRDRRYGLGLVGTTISRNIPNTSPACQDT